MKIIIDMEERTIKEYRQPEYDSSVTFEEKELDMMILLEMLLSEISAHFYKIHYGQAVWISEVAKSVIWRVKDSKSKLWK